MKVIFLKDYLKIAKKGQLKQVADGLARNFLLPQKIACVATTSAILELEKRMEKEALEKNKTQEKKGELAERINGQTFFIKRKASQEKIFGSISPADIVLELKKAGWEIAEKDIIWEQPIKKIGRYEIKVFPKEKKPASFTLEVQAE